MSVAAAPRLVPLQATAISRTWPLKSGRSSGNCATPSAPACTGGTNRVTVFCGMSGSTKLPSSPPWRSTVAAPSGGAISRPQSSRMSRPSRRRPRKWSVGSGETKLVSRRMPSSTAARLTQAPGAVCSLIAARARGGYLSGHVERHRQLAHAGIDADPGEADGATGTRLRVRRRCGTRAPRHRRRDPSRRTPARRHRCRRRAPTGCARDARGRSAPAALPGRRTAARCGCARVSPGA